jgi:integrase
LQHFVDTFGDVSLASITGAELQRWANKNGKRVGTGEIQPSTLRQDFRCVRQLYNWAYDQHIIEERPRNLKNFGKQTQSAIRKRKRKPVRTFTKAEIQKLYKGCDTKKLISKWWNRTDTELPMLKLAIVLAVNTGMTQQDLSDLRMNELFLEKRPPRCIRQRSKTGQDSNHWLFRESVRLLKEHCEGKKGEDRVLLRRDGRPLVIASVVDGIKTGSRSDALGASFRRLVERVLGKDDPRRFRELRRTGANYCKQREAGTETLYLSHADARMSSLYTKPAQRQFDKILTYLEADMGFAHGYGLYKMPARRKKKT